MTADLFGEPVAPAAKRGPKLPRMCIDGPATGRVVRMAENARSTTPDAAACLLSQVVYYPCVLKLVGYAAGRTLFFWLLSTHSTAEGRNMDHALHVVTTRKFLGEFV